MDRSICSLMVSIKDINESLLRLVGIMLETGNLNGESSCTAYISIEYSDVKGNNKEVKIKNINEMEIIKATLCVMREIRYTIQSVRKVFSNGLSISITLTDSGYLIDCSQDLYEEASERLGIIMCNEKPCEDYIVHLDGNEDTKIKVSQVISKWLVVHDCVNIILECGIINIIYCDKLIVAIRNKSVYLIDLYGDNIEFIRKIVKHIELIDAGIRVQEQSYI